MRSGERDRDRVRRRSERALEGSRVEAAVEIVAAAATAAASAAFFSAGSCSKYCFFGTRWRLVCAFGTSVTALGATLGTAGCGVVLAA